MGKNTKISWCTHTFNPWHGCSKVSAGCQHCYAETMTKRWGDDYWGKEGKRRFMGDKYWAQPFKWNDEAKRDLKPALVFCGSMCDVFEERRDLIDVRDRLWNVIGSTPWLRWLLLTKRPENIEALMPIYAREQAWYARVWLGVSVENQKAVERVKILADIPVNVRFISAEPLLEYINIAPWLKHYSWVIVGGESGRGCRPMKEEWAKHVLMQCRETNTSFFMKQMGGFPDKREKMDDIPNGLKIRQIPME